MAAAALDRALALNPNAAHAWLAGGSIHALRNEPAEAIEAIERARRLSPFDPCTFLYASNIAAAHLAARRFEQAIEWADRALHDQPRHVPAMRVKVVVLAHLGHLDEARAELSRAASLYGLPLSEVDRPCCDSADPLTWMVGWLWSVANIIAARFECVATFSTRGSFSNHSLHQEPVEVDTRQLGMEFTACRHRTIPDRPIAAIGRRGGSERPSRRRASVLALEAPRGTEVCRLFAGGNEIRTVSPRS